MAEPAIRLETVSKRFPGRPDAVTAVADVSFDLPRGQVVALMGDNGAGKSTLLDLVCGLSEPSSGTVRVLGGEPRAAVRDGRVSAVLQTGGLLPDLTVGETVELVASLFGRPAAAQDALERAGLTAITGRRIAVCSGGERQRVKVAMALVPEADLLVLDEPTAGMDWGARARFWAEMRGLAARGRTLLYASHYADEVVGIADRVLVLQAGRLAADTCVDAILTAGGVPVSALGEAGFFGGLSAVLDRTRHPGPREDVR